MNRCLVPCSTVNDNNNKQTNDNSKRSSDLSKQSSDSNKQSESKTVFKHDKDGLSIYITIYNTNNNANEDSEAGLKQKAETGGQISGQRGRNANQGGQIAGNCGQNANQDGEVASEGCGSCEDSSEDDTSVQE